MILALCMSAIWAAGGPAEKKEFYLNARKKASTEQEQLQNNSLNQNAFNADVADRINLIGNELSDNETAIAEAQSRIDGLEKDSEDNSITFLKITVQEEDTLLSICERLGLNYEESAKMILGINGLSDESEIASGQTMLIPVS